MVPKGAKEYYGTLSPTVLSTTVQKLILKTKASLVEADC